MPSQAVETRFTVRELRKINLVNKLLHFPKINYSFVIIKKKKKTSPFGQMSVQGLHILIPFSSTSILELGQARTQELESTTKLSNKRGKSRNNVGVQQKSLKLDILEFKNDHPY